MSCSAAASMCSWLSRTASSPAYSRGCNVLTRPSMISGNPVKSSIARTFRPASSSEEAVPPVETSSTPRSASPCANSTIPRLSETDSSARRMRTAPGAAASGPVGESVCSAIPRAYGSDRIPGLSRAWLKQASAGEPGRMPVNDPAEKIEADAAELEERIGKLDNRIGEATQAADARPGENKPLEETAGDWEDSEGGPLGDDAEGFDDPEAEEDDE